MLRALTRTFGALLLPAGLASCATSSLPAPSATASQRPVRIAKVELDEPRAIGAEAEEIVTPPEPDPAPPVRHPFHEPLPTVQELAAGPASEIANLSSVECRRRLEAVELAVERFRGPARGVGLPLRIVGEVGDVHYQVPSARTPFGLLDCRLALVLARLSEVLVEHEVTRIRIDNFYRPRARLPGRRSPSQHAHGLAADIVEFGLRDGRTLNVERDWQGSRGAAPCGPDAELLEDTDETVRLRNLVCAIASLGIFHHILTPNYDAAHRDHLHVDIKRDAKWFSVR